MPIKHSDEQYDEAETTRRREAALKKMLSTAHVPHKANAKRRDRTGRTGRK
jgi:hypothetical protein